MSSDDVRRDEWQASRRRLLGIGLSLGIGALGAGALAACGGGSKSTSGGSSKSVKLPNYSPPRSVPGATISQVAGVGPAYDAYPQPPYKSVASPPITSGKPVTTFQILYPAPPPALGDNKWWQELNKRLGGEYKPTLAPYQGYADKLQTTVASGNIPDITWIEPGQGAQSIIRTLQQGAFTDLSEIVAGDGIKAYPNLAQIPTYAWKNCAIEGVIYGVPKPISALISEAPLSYRQDWATKLGYPQAPTNADELFELFQAFGKGDPTGTKGQTWAIGALYQRWYYMMFGVPYNWRQNSDGTLTYYNETDEIAAALAYANKLWKAGAFHPDAPTQAWTSKAEELFLTDKVGALGGGINSHFGAGDNAMGHFRSAHKGIEVTHMLSPAHDGGGKAGIYQQAGYFGICAIPSKVGKDTKRVEELLRVMDFMGAPFGSEEFLFLNYGMEGRQYTLDGDGNPAPATGAVLDEINLNYLNEPDEAVFYYPGVKGDSVAAQKLVEQAAASWVPDPTQGLVSDTYSRKFAAIKQINDDYEIGIITGRRPMSDLSGWRDDFKKSGGDQMRKEFEESLQRAKK